LIILGNDNVAVFVLWDVVGTCRPIHGPDYYDLMFLMFRSSVEKRIHVVKFWLIEK